MENIPDALRRSLLIGLGVLPLAELVPGQRPAWALTNHVDIEPNSRYQMSNRLQTRRRQTPSTS